jgi:hypothetical protein
MSGNSWLLAVTFSLYQIAVAQAPSEIDVILFIFPVQMETPRHREVKQLAPSLTA